MNVMNIDLNFHHVGIGTTQFDDAVSLYEMIGYELATSVDDHRLGVRVAFLSNANAASPWIEILAPLGDSGPLRSLRERGLLPSPYHTCYAVRDMQRAQEAFRRSGLVRISKVTPALAFDDALVAFFFSKAAGMIELVENPPPLESREQPPISVN